MFVGWQTMKGIVVYKRENPALLKKAGLVKFVLTGVGSSNCPPHKQCKFMKILRLFALLAVVLTVFNACQKDELVVDETDALVSVQETPDVFVENGYLVFKSIEVFDSIRSEIEELNLNDCIEWEESLGFVSASTEKYFAEEEANKIISEEEVATFQEKFSDKFNIEEDLFIKYKFYSSGLANILNINGCVKIEGSFYKFTSDKEYISLDGDQSSLLNTDSKLKSLSISEDNNIVVFDPFKNDNNLKSTTILDNGIKQNGIRRLVWSVEKYVFNSLVNFDPYTGQMTYKAGCQLTLIMNQEKYRGTFKKKWRNNEASYSIVNQYIDWSETGVSPAPGYVGSFSDEYIGTTRKTVRVHYIDRLYYANEPFNVDFSLRDFKVEFWSSGIGESYKVSLDL